MKRSPNNKCHQQHKANWEVKSSETILADDVKQMVFGAVTLSYDKKYVQLAYSIIKFVKLT